MNDLDVTNAQWADIHARAALPVGDPRRLNRAMVQALREGRVQLPQSVPEGDLPPHHYRVRTTGVLPAFNRLNGELYNGASELYNGKYVWQPHESNVSRDMTPGNRVFLLKGFGVRTTVEMAILWGQEHDYSSATHTEANDFGTAYPELQRKNPILSAGSSAVDGGSRCVALLYGDDGRRDLDNDNFGRVCGPHGLFLFVSNTLGHSEP